MKPDLMRPRLGKQVVANSPESAQQRSMIFKKNLSRFFVHLYKSIYGGRIKSDPSQSGFNRVYYFSPDVGHIEEGRDVYTEVKATSRRSAQIHSGLIQESNNLGELLVRAGRGKAPPPMIQYACFRYGVWAVNGLQNLNNHQLMTTLAGLEKELVVVPLNVFLFLTSFSRFERRDQQNSGYHIDQQDYHLIRGSVLTDLMDNTLLQNGGETLPIQRILSLGDVEVEHYETPVIRGRYGKSFEIRPFPVTRYSMSGKKYDKWVKSLLENHEELTMTLGIRDLFQERKKLPF